jgi:type I restriction enzyme S subunit
MENPKIRFKGFTKDWEQRKLGELGSLKNGMNFSKEAMGHGFPFINLQNIFGNNVIDVNKLELADATEKQLLEYSLLKGDVLFVRSSVKLEGVGEAALVPETLENTTYSGFIIRFRDEYGLNNDFKKYIFGTQKVRNQIMAQATNSANKNISQGVLENLTFEVPSFDEQAKIGEHFSNLDHLITLHQRKCEQTKKLKKYMLQKMFPQNGAKVPEIRFDGFTYDWEQRKFSELYARSSEKNDGSIGMDKNITVATMQFKNDVKVSTTEYLKTYYTFKLGDIAFEGHQSKEFRYGRFVENDIGNGIVSHIFAVFRPIQEYDLYFWKYAINNETLMQRILARSTKASTMMHDLVTNDFLNETFLVPSVKEQKQIGAFLNKLDNLITLHQRQHKLHLNMLL